MIDADVAKHPILKNVETVFTQSQRTDISIISGKEKRKITERN